MAKAKKETLSLEELLEQAIVKEEDRPYEVPGNWVWTRLGEILSVSSGKSLTSSKMVSEGKIPVYGGNGVTGYHNNYNVDIPTIVIGRVGFYCGSIHFIRENAWVTDNALIVSFPKDKIDISFLYWLLSNTDLRRNDSSTAQPVISGSKIYGLEIPLPPLTEQQRIVEVIESLFEKLDTAKELVQNALDSFESRKAAILHKAFTGELTARWREKNGVSLDYWEDKPLKDLCNSFQYGTSKKSETTGNVVVLRMGNMQDGKLDWTNLVYTSDEEDIKKYFLKYGDVLFNRTNSPELVGKTSIYRGERPAIFAGYLIRINYKPCLSGEYLNYLLNSPKAKEYCNEVKSDGVNQSNINAQKLGQFKVPYCSLQEQQEIVRILDKLLENEQRAKELSDVVERIDLMKKAILARAFRGELGTNIPEEESAVELLKGILKERK